MFDYTQDQIKRIIDSRKNEIIPLYVVIMGIKYSLLELDNIENFNPSGFKVGYGTSTSLFNKSSKYWRYVSYNVNCVDNFKIEDVVNTSYDTYYVFESNRFNDEDIKNEMYEEINEYFDMLFEFIKSISMIKHREKIKELMKNDI